MENGPASWSYARHAQHELSLSKTMAIPACYMNPQGIEAWRQDRIRKTIVPLLVTDPDATWITIGDGAFGADAYFLKRHGIDALATSLTDSTLAIAQSQGYVGKFRSINAEEIALPDNSYDYVLCKEAYHHLPRPPIALYEMLRVARKAVVLIEPRGEPVQDGGIHEQQRGPDAR